MNPPIKREGEGKMSGYQCPVDFGTATAAIVDDDRAMHVIIRKTLEREKIGTILDAYDLASARRLFAEHRVDVVVLDVNMPDGSGIELIPELIREDDDLSPGVLMLTASEDLSDAREALRLGADDYLSKPVDSALLARRAARTLALRLSYRRLNERREELEGEVRRRTAQLERAYRELAIGLGRAASFRDNETWEHVRRMSDTCTTIAAAIGWSETDVETLRLASTTHDVGKIGIPDRILFKPGALTKDERKVMEQHAEIGAQILQGDESALIAMARAIALSHHEWWDGSGYPKGLSGEDIPLVGRITAIADVYDALTNERPYKAAWTAEAARAHIRDGAGTHFDPHLVDVFLSTVPGEE